MTTRPRNHPAFGCSSCAPAEDSNTLRTDIAAFAGPTERGPLGELVRIAGWREYLSRFGEFSERATTAFALRGYFENEGDIAYVVRTAAAAVAAWADWTVGELDPVTHAWLPSAPASGGFAAARYRIEASSPGLWANGLEVVFSYRRFGARGAPEVDLIVRPRQRRRRGAERTVAGHARRGCGRAIGPHPAASRSGRHCRGRAASGSTQLHLGRRCASAAATSSHPAAPSTSRRWS